MAARAIVAAISIFLSQLKYIPPHTSPIKTEGESGVRCVATSCACLGAGKGETSGNLKKCRAPLRSVRFFRLPPLPSTSAPFGRPTTHAPFHSAGVAPAKRLRLQGQPLSWLLARSGLPQLPPNPQSGAAYGRILFTGASAPLLFSAPAWSPARRFPLRSAKAHRVFAPSSSAPLRTCPPTRHPLVASSSGAPPQRHRRPRSFVPSHNPYTPQSARPSGGVGLPGATGRVVLITHFVVKLWLLDSGEG